MRYCTSNGVVLTEVYGVYVLVSAKEAREKLPYLTEINETAAYCWRHMEKGTTLPGLLEAIAAEYDLEDPEETGRDVKALIDQLLEAGYIREEKEDQNEESL